MSESRRKEFIASLKNQLDEADERIDRLEQKLHDAGEDAENQYRERLAELRTHRDKASKKLQELRDAGEERWDGVKAEAEHVWKAMRNSLHYFQSHFKD